MPHTECHCCNFRLWSLKALKHRIRVSSNDTVLLVIFVYIYIYIYIYIYTHTHTYICMCLYMYTHTHIFLSFIYLGILFFHIYIYTHTHTRARTHTHMSWSSTSSSSSSSGILIRVGCQLAPPIIPKSASTLLFLSFVYLLSWSLQRSFSSPEVVCSFTFEVVRGFGPVLHV